MRRRFAVWLFHALFFHADVSTAPPRTAEYLLAWTIICWSATVLVCSGSMNGPAYHYMIVIARERFWGSFGVCFGLLRIAALIINGSWHRTPLLRFAGAMTGMVWWVMVGGLFLLAVRSNAEPFPMLGAYPVLAFFEAYSCYRCGQDARAMRSLSLAPSRGPVATGGSNGD